MNGPGFKLMLPSDIDLRGIVCCVEQNADEYRGMTTLYFDERIVYLSLMDRYGMPVKATLTIER